MNGRSKIIHLTSRLKKICNSEQQVNYHFSRSSVCAHRLGYQESVLQPNKSCQNFKNTLLLTPKLCSTSAIVVTQQPGRIKKMIKKMGWFNHSKSKLKRSGYLLYATTSDRAIVADFFKVCGLPDTYYSWFLVTELHTWMLMVRLMAEGKEGRFTRNAVIEALWKDSEIRAKKLGILSQSTLREQMRDLGSSFQAAVIAYDEGLMGDDHVLASALWRRLFCMNCDDPERLECCVQFVRKQIAALDGTSRNDLMLNCKVEWLPLLECDTSTERS